MGTQCNLWESMKESLKCPACQKWDLTKESLSVPVYLKACFFNTITALQDTSLFDRFLPYNSRSKFSTEKARKMSAIVVNWSLTIHQQLSYQIPYWWETNHKIHITGRKSQASCIWTKDICPRTWPENLERSCNPLDSPINIGLFNQISSSDLFFTSRWTRITVGKSA